MIVIMGPTACGKSAAGLFVAEAVSGEIVSADSMQIYKGMDTGTATPTKAERARVPHHLIDIRYPWESYDAATFARDATAAARAIEHRGRVAVVVGGTALYLKALLEGLFDGPPADARVRRRLRAAAAADGSAALHHMLAEVDPESAAKLHPNDLLRIVRALEVYECTGRPLSSYQTQFGRPREDLSAQALCLCRDRGDLDARIDRRVDHMFAEGLVQEVRALAEHPAGLGPTADPGSANASPGATRTPKHRGSVMVRARSLDALSLKKNRGTRPTARWHIANTAKDTPSSQTGGGWRFMEMGTDIRVETGTPTSTATHGATDRYSGWILQSFIGRSRVSQGVPTAWAVSPSTAQVTTESLRAK